MKYLVTDGSGFIDSNIAQELLNMGEDVRVLDNFSTGKRGKIFCFKNYKYFNNIGKIIKKDIPISNDRLLKFANSTDYRSEKIRELGYIQNH